MPWALCVGGQRDGQQFPDAFKVDGGAQSTNASHTSSCPPSMAGIVTFHRGMSRPWTPFVVQDMINLRVAGRSPGGSSAARSSTTRQVVVETNSGPDNDRTPEPATGGGLGTHG
jgi:hypothetical protein